MDPIQALGIGEVSLRLAIALLSGGILGLNRELNNKAAGLRTHILVTLGSTLITISSLHFTNDGHITNLDALSRVIQGILTGIGFVGGGVILRDVSSSQVYGLTTAATIWCAAGLGLACGLGYWRFVLLCVGVILLVLILGGPIERFFLQFWREKISPEDKQ